MNKESKQACKQTSKPISNNKNDSKITVNIVAKGQGQSLVWQDEPGHVTELKLMCNWLTSGSLRCKTGQGVDFNNTVSDRLTFTGPAMEDKTGGQFVCDVLAPGIREIPCTLTLEGK